MIALQTLLAQDAGFQFSWLKLAVIIFVIVSVLMILIVLMQRPQGGGLSGAFGASSDGAGQTAFGAKTGDALTLATVTIFILFLGCAIALNYMVRPGDEQPVPVAEGAEDEESGVSDELPATGATEEGASLGDFGGLTITELGAEDEGTEDEGETETPASEDDAEAPSDG